MMDLSSVSKAIDTRLKEGVSGLQEELQKLYDELKRANEDLSSNEAQTDKSENAFYQEAVNRKQNISAQIGLVEERLRRFNYNYEKYCHENHSPSKRIGIGSTIRLLSKTNGKEYVVKLVPVGADNPQERAISIGSPVGKAVLNRKEGEEIQCLTAKKTLQYLIKEVN